MLEKKCTQYDKIKLNIGIEHLAKENGDHAILCYFDNEMVGILTWYTDDGIVANINGMVHPEYRRKGIFSNLLKFAKEDIKKQGIKTLIYRFLKDSESGFRFVSSLNVEFERSEYSMTLSNLQNEKRLRYLDLYLSSMEPEDFEFAIKCSSQAFGHSEEWSREFFSRTDEPSNKTYIVKIESENVGLIRINYLSPNTAVIYSFCIIPSHQGKGIGQDVLRKTVSLLLEEQCTNIRLSVVTNNDRALNLYKKVGFEVTSEFKYYKGDL
ncbi:GNAT family N-acetyltransferase [Clostridium sp. AL.422]|uniref:GNAT family N-acetyltransferase n=1 Tax=Clostridium TaxID=1485 RepID=UPI00293DCDF2|nr:MULTISPECIES: GNAT family N-acetyltransferase [unclassified Clostridium]MDV4150068.1 GNAT family N-acetyltransferase [Clostridium sp. AL.422]